MASMKPIYVKICPVCGSTDTRNESTDMYIVDVCKNCGIRLPSFFEVEESEIEHFREQIKKNNSKSFSSDKKK